jgi:hypothetical protein
MKEKFSLIFRVLNRPPPTKKLIKLHPCIQRKGCGRGRMDTGARCLSARRVGQPSRLRIPVRGLPREVHQARHGGDPGTSVSVWKSGVPRVEG